jgi:hypothetical protein
MLTQGRRWRTNLGLEAAIPLGLSECNPAILPVCFHPAHVRSSVRSGIFVEPRLKQISSPGGAKYAAPDGALIIFEFPNYKDGSPDGL